MTQETAVRSRRNPISKPMRRQSGKLRMSGAKMTLTELSVSAVSAADGSSGTAAETRSLHRKIGGSFEDRPDSQGTTAAVDVNPTDAFHSPLAERVKLRRMSQLSDVSVSSSDGDADKIDSSESKSVSSATKKAPSNGTKNLLKPSTNTGRKSICNNTASTAHAKKQSGSVKLAITKKKLAICNAVKSKSSKTRPSRMAKSAEPVAKRSVQNQQASSGEKLPPGSAADKRKQPSKDSVTQKSESKTTVSKPELVSSQWPNQKAVAVHAVQSKKSTHPVKESGNRIVKIGEKMPRLKANKQQNPTSSPEKSMPVLQQEIPAVKSDQSAKKSLRKRQQSPPPTVVSKLPKLSTAEEMKLAAEKRGSLRSSITGPETSHGDDDMPQLSAVELMDKMKPLKVHVGQFDCPPALDRSPLCGTGEDIDVDQNKPGRKSPVQCFHDNKDTAGTASPRSAKTTVEGTTYTSKNSVPAKHSPTRSKHRADVTPVSNHTALSQNNCCNVSSQLAVTQTVCSVSSPHSMVEVMQTKCSSISVDISDSQQLVAVTPAVCGMFSQPRTSAPKQTVSEIVSVSETHPEDEFVSTTVRTEPAGEVVRYACTTNRVGGQWQVPCGVPMAPFVITGMYPVMGSGCGYPMISFPPLVPPGSPAATSVISSRGCSLSSPPLQYSSYRLPAAAPVVPLYMSPVVGPFVQPCASTSQVNLMPFMPSLPHAAAAVHNQRSSSATVILRPSMLSPERLYTVNCMLPAQQQVTVLLSSLLKGRRNVRRSERGLLGVETVGMVMRKA